MRPSGRGPSGAGPANEMTTRRIPPERRVRAVAALHAAVGAAAVGAALAWLAVSATHAHGRNDLGAAAVPVIAGLEVLGGAAFLAIAGLLWAYNPVARWTTGVLLA